jgi:XRE family transcriptional regulator, regulator of sulfur utilization
MHDTTLLRQTIGSNIRRVRESLGWSQEKLAVRAQLSLNFIGNLERGKVNISIDSLSRIMSAMSVRFEDVFHRERAEAPTP